MVSEEDADRGGKEKHKKEVKKREDSEAYKSKERIQRKVIILQERFQTTKIISGNIYMNKWHENLRGSSNCDAWGKWMTVDEYSLM